MALLFTLFALSVLATPEQALQCKEVTFTVSGTAQNRNISNVDFNNLQALTQVLSANNFSRFEVSGQQEIAGWYCEPTKRSLKVDKLQVLLGPITTNREFWTAQGGTALQSPPYKPYKPNIYSWTQYANAQGYATLTFDHLGNGKSSHPDPMNIVQSPYEVELYHDMVQQIKSGGGGGSPLPRTFQHLAFVGCSYGSVIGNLMAKKYPLDFEDTILTGFSKSVLPSLPGVAAQGAQPASKADPARFGNLPAGYLATPNETTRTQSFFGDPKIVDFESENAHLFFTREDVVSTGQFVSTYTDIVEAPEYRCRVLVLTGEEDQAFCGPGSSALTPPAHCGKLLAETKSLYPNADYSYQSIPRSGHALILHSSAPQTLEVAHDFLAGKKFGGQM